MKKKTPVKRAAKHQGKQAKLLTELIDKKIEARVAGLESTVTKMFKLFKKIKTTSSPKKMLDLEKELKSMKNVIEDFNVKSLEEDIFKQFDVIKRDSTKSIENQKNTIEDMGIELSSVKKDLETFQDFEKEFTEMDLKNIRNDIEAIKQKTEWVESEVERINLSPLLERIDELENRISNMKLSQPMIIE